MPDETRRLESFARIALPYLGLLLGTWLAGVVLLHTDLGWPARWGDRHVATWVVDHRTPWLTHLALDWTRLGTARVLLLTIAVVGGGLSLRARRARPLLLLLAAHVGAALVYEPAKRLVERPRPRLGPVLAHESSYAFPSGHSAQAAAVGGMLTVLLLERVPHPRLRQLLRAVVTVLAVGIALSRVELGVHWTTDVLWGALIGGVWCAALLAADRAAAADPNRSAGPSPSNLATER